MVTAVHNVKKENSNMLKIVLFAVCATVACASYYKGGYDSGYGGYGKGPIIINTGYGNSGYGSGYGNGGWGKGGHKEIIYGGNIGYGYGSSLEGYGKGYGGYGKSYGGYGGHRGYVVDGGYGKGFDGGYGHGYGQGIVKIGGGY